MNPVISTPRGLVAFLSEAIRPALADEMKTY